MLDRGVGAERGRLREPLRVPARRDHPRCAQQLRGLHRDQPDRSCRPEHEDRLAAVERRTPGERKPAGEPRDAERSRECGVDAGGNLDGRRVADQSALRHPAVATEPEAAAEDPHGATVCSAPDRLAPGHVRRRRIPGVVGARGDAEVDRVERRREHLDDVTGRLVDLPQLGTRAELANQRRPHVENLDGATVRPRPEPGLAGREAMPARRCRKPEEGGSWGRHGFPHGL